MASTVLNGVNFIPTLGQKGFSYASDEADGGPAGVDAVVRKDGDMKQRRRSDFRRYYGVALKVGQNAVL